MGKVKNMTATEIKEGWERVYKFTYRCISNLFPIIIKKLIIREARRIIKDKEDYQPCEPNCVKCLIAVAKGHIDNKLGIKMSFGDFVAGIYGSPTMKTDFIMLEIIKEVKSGKLIL